MTRRDDSGQLTVMIVGFFVVIGLLAVVVINASAAFLQRQQLNNAAYGAALAAAAGLSEEVAYRDGIDNVADIALDRRRAAQVVDDYLTSHDDLQWQVGGDGTRVTVRLSRSLDLPLVPPGWMDSTRVTAEATALLRLH